jgi:hypothetical protein
MACGVGLASGIGRFVLNLGNLSTYYKDIIKMKKVWVLCCILGITTVVGSYSLYAWGAWGHLHINRAAVFALPSAMRTFFYNHIDFLTEESVIPDVRKYVNDKSEAPRHFIDIEDFGNLPIDSLPKTWKEATAKYDDKTLQKNGILAWYILEIQAKLTEAMKDRKKSEILYLSADLGHYLADAHMPLHTSSNYDGQMTGQKGIHAFWESQLPELFGDTYNFNVGSARYIQDPIAETWRIIAASHAAADTLLAVEKKLTKALEVDKVYEMDSLHAIRKNKYNQPIHSKVFARLYHTALNGMVERQMRASIATTANFWYTAWVNAGKPDLTSLDSEATTKRHKKQLKEELKLWQKGKLFGFKSNAEF